MIYFNYFIEDNKTELENVVSIYELKKDHILKSRITSKIKKDFIKIFDIIEHFNKGNITDVIKKLYNSHSIDIPLIKRYIAKYK